jgi:hypothetical protein
MNLHRSLLLVKNKSIILENLKQAKSYLTAGKISQEDLTNIVNADPTPQKKYVGWMAKIFIQDKTDIDDLRNTVEEFNTFLNKGKTRTKDINAFKSFKDLKSEIDNLNNSGEGISIGDSENDYEVIINNSDLLIICPHTHEASRKLGLSKFAFRDCKGGGKDSAWCTTYKAPDHFNDYYYKNNVTFYYIRVKSPEMIDKLKEAFPGQHKKDKKLERYKAMEVTALAVLSSGQIDGYDGLDDQINKKDISIYINILGISNILIPRRPAEEREKNYGITIQNKIKQYMKDGGKGDLELSNTPITSLPAGLSVGGYLDLYASKITSLPDGLSVDSTLDLTKTKITSLPNNLSVGGNLNLGNTLITSLPDNLSIGGKLYLGNIKIKSLPNNLSVGGDLDLMDTSITSLSNNLSVGGSLYLVNTKITSIPAGLSVNGGLDLSNTKVTSLSNDLSVGGTLWLRNTPISKQYTTDQLKRMLPRVKGKILI